MCAVEAGDEHQPAGVARIELRHEVAVRIGELTVELRVVEEVFGGVQPHHSIPNRPVELPLRLPLVGIIWLIRVSRRLNRKEDVFDQGLRVRLEIDRQRGHPMADHRGERRHGRGAAEGDVAAGGQKQIGPQHGVEHFLGRDAHQHLGMLAGPVFERVHRVEVGGEDRQLDADGLADVLVQLGSGVDWHIRP